MADPVRRQLFLSCWVLYRRFPQSCLVVALITASLLFAAVLFRVGGARDAVEAVIPAAFPGPCGCGGECCQAEPPSMGADPRYGPMPSPPGQAVDSGEYRIAWTALVDGVRVEVPAPPEEPMPVEVQLEVPALEQIAPIPDPEFSSVSVPIRPAIQVVESHGGTMK